MWPSRAPPVELAGGRGHHRGARRDVGVGVDLAVRVVQCHADLFAAVLEREHLFDAGQRVRASVRSAQASTTVRIRDSGSAAKEPVCSGEKHTTSHRPTGHAAVAPARRCSGPRRRDPGRTRGSGFQTRRRRRGSGSPRDSPATPGPAGPGARAADHPVLPGGRDRHPLPGQGVLAHGGRGRADRDGRGGRPRGAGAGGIGIIEVDDVPAVGELVGAFRIWPMLSGVPHGVAVRLPAGSAAGSAAVTTADGQEQPVLRVQDRHGEADVRQEAPEASTPSVQPGRRLPPAGTPAVVAVAG